MLWAVAVQIFSGPIDRHGARAVNLFKCLSATLLLGLTLILTGGWRAFADTPGFDLSMIALSGIVGLTLGDTALFGAVNRIGPHRSLLLQTLAPVCAAALAWPMGERLSAVEVWGSLVVLAGVLIVLSGAPSAGGGRSSRRGLGILLGVLAAAGQGAGVTIAKMGMDTVPVLPATFLRLGVGAAGLVVIALAIGGLGRSVRAWSDPKTLGRLTLASFLGTYLAMLLMMTGVARAPASVAAVLLSTPPVFGLVVEAIVTKRLPTLRGVFGTIVALSGVALLTMSQP